MQKIFSDLINCFLRFFTLDYSKIYRANTFLHWKDCLFSKSMCLKQPLKLPKKRSHNLHHTSQDTLWSITKNYSMSVIVGNRGKIGPKSFFLRDDSFIFEKFGSRLLRSYKKRSYRLHHTCWKTLWTLIYCSLTFIVFDNARKNRPDQFFHWKGCLSFSKACVSKNPLNPTKVI